MCKLYNSNMSIYESCTCIGTRDVLYMTLRDCFLTIAFVEEWPMSQSCLKPMHSRARNLAKMHFLWGILKSGEWIYAGFISDPWLFQVWTRGGETSKTRTPELRKNDPWRSAKELFIEQFGQGAQSQAGSLKEFVLVPVGEEKRTMRFFVVARCT